MKKSQETLSGFHLNDLVGYVPKHGNAGYVAEIVEILDDDIVKGRSFVCLDLKNGATVNVWDDKLVKLPNDTAHH